MTPLSAALILVLVIHYKPNYVTGGVSGVTFSTLRK